MKLRSFIQLFALFVMLVGGLSAGAISADGKSEPPCIPAWNGFAGSEDLPSTILSSARATDGFIYLGGRDGLYRIDGAGVSYWAPDFTDDTALPAGRIGALAADGRFLWVGTAAGLARFDTQTNRFERVLLGEGRGAAPSIHALKVTGRGVLVATPTGIQLVESSNGAFSIQNLSYRGKNIGEVSAFTEFEGGIYAGGEAGLFLIKANETIESIDVPEQSDAIRHILVGPGKQFWAVTRSGLYQSAEPRSGDWTVLDQESLPGLPEGDLTAATVDYMGRVWVASARGLSRWDPNTDRAIDCRRSVQGSDRDQDVPIVHLSGGLGPYLFMGTQGRGAARASLDPSVYRVIPGERFNEGLPANPIWSSGFADDGTLYVGTSRGLYRSEGDFGRAFSEVASDHLGDRRIYAATGYRDGSVWVGTNRGAYRIQNGVVEPLSLLQSASGDPVVPSVFAIKPAGDTILLATGSGLIIIDGPTQRVRGFIRGNPEHSLSQDAPTLDFQVPRMWGLDIRGHQAFIAADTAALVVDLETLTVEQSTHAATEEGVFSAGRIYSIVSTDDGKVLMGTEAGLIEANAEFTAFEKVSEINGVRLNSVMSAGRDNYGAIWLGVANTGLFRRLPGSARWRHFSVGDGLLTNGVSQLGLSHSVNGYTLVSNATGLSILPQQSRAEVGDLDLDLRARERQRDLWLDLGSTMTIQPGERELRIQFLVPEILESGLYQVVYKFGPDRSDAPARTIPLGEELTFAGLSPGLHRMSAFLVSSSGLKSAPIAFAFQVQPSWWERAELYYLLIFILLAVPIVFFLLRARLTEFRYSLVADERKRIAQNLHDTSLQDIFGARMIGRTISATAEAEQTNEKVSKVMELLETATASIRSSVTELSELTDVPPLSDAIRKCEPPAKYGQEVEVVVVEEGQIWPISSQRRFFLARIVQEAITNACKHARASEITVHLNWRWRGLTVCVVDNGIGFDLANRSTDSVGFGLGAMERMAKAARAGLTLKSEPGEGTQVSVTVRRFII